MTSENVHRGCHDVLSGHGSLKTRVSKNWLLLYIYFIKLLAPPTSSHGVIVSTIDFWSAGPRFESRQEPFLYFLPKAWIIWFCVAFHRNFCSVGYRNFCSEATEISVTHTTEISVNHTAEISVKSSAKADDSSFYYSCNKITKTWIQISRQLKWLFLKY